MAATTTDNDNEDQIMTTKINYNRKSAAKKSAGGSLIFSIIFYNAFSKLS